MVAILKRLQDDKIDLPSPFDDKNSWDFTQKVKSRDIDFFRYLVINHQSLDIEYRVYCSQLARDLLRKDASEIPKQIETALMMAELLEYIYQYYLYAPERVARFRQEQNVYRNWMVTQGYQFSSNDQSRGVTLQGQLSIFKKNDTVPSSISEDISEYTGIANFLRNFITRLRRLLLATTPLASEFNRYRTWIGLMDGVLAPVLSYAGWMFFVPRTAMNLFLTAKHLIPGTWMSDEEQSLDLKTRFGAQMALHWVELGNDIVWMSLSLLNCFVLTGALAPVGFYASAGLLAYDVGLAALRVHIEIGRLQKLEEDYKRMLDGPDLSAVERQQVNSYLIHLQDRITYEQKRLYIHVVNTSVLFLSFLLAFPYFAFNPVIPVIGAVLAVLVTIACYVSVQVVAKQKPVDIVAIIPVPKKSPSITSHGFFRLIPDDPSSPLDTHIIDGKSAPAPSLQGP